jgi:hypothetical protein
VNAIVQSVLAVLPELKVLGNESKATPVGRSRNITSIKFGLEGAHSIFKFLAGGEWFTLIAGVRANLVPARAGIEVLVGLCVTDARHGSLDTNLPSEWFAVPEDGRPGVLREIVTLVGVVVSEPHKAVLIGGAQEHHAARDPALAIGCGDRDGFRFTNFT